MAGCIACFRGGGPGGLRLELRCRLPCLLHCSLNRNLLEVPDSDRAGRLIAVAGVQSTLIGPGCGLNCRLRSEETSCCLGSSLVYLSATKEVDGDPMPGLPLRRGFSDMSFSATTRE